MSIGALAALPIVGDLAKVAGDLAKAAVPLAQPFADVLAKALGNALDPESKTVDFSSTQEKEARPITYTS